MNRRTLTKIDAQNEQIYAARVLGIISESQVLQALLDHQNRRQLTAALDSQNLTRSTLVGLAYELEYKAEPKQF